jgi:hypothetical protein
VIPAVRICGSTSMSRAKGLLRAPTNTGPMPLGQRTTATLSKGRQSVNPYDSAALAHAAPGMPLSHFLEAKSCRVRTRCEGALNAQGMHKSMVARSAHTAGTTLRLGVSSLSRDQVELLLRLIEAETDALLVEQPEIPTDGCVDEPQLVELTAELANAKAQLTVGLAEIVDPLGEPLVSLFERLADIDKPRVHVPAHVLDPLQQQLVSLLTLRLSAAQLLAHGGVRVPQLFQRRIDMDDGPARVIDQVEEMTEV